MPEIQAFLFDTDCPGNISQQRAQELVEPYLAGFARATQAAFRGLNSMDREVRDKLRPSVRGQVVTDLIWSHVQDELTEMDGVEFCQRLNFFKAIIVGEVVVRFKRLNNHLLAASEGTDQAVAWFGNQPISGIPSHLLRLNFGYRPDSHWLSCSEFYVTHQSSFKTLAWHSPLQNVYADNETERSAHGLPPIEIVPKATPVREDQA